MEYGDDLKCEMEFCYYKVKHREDQMECFVYQESVFSEPVVLCDVCVQYSDIENIQNAKKCKTCEVYCCYEVDDFGGLCNNCYSLMCKSDEYFKDFMEELKKRRYDYNDLQMEINTVFREGDEEDLFHYNLLEVPHSKFRDVFNDLSDFLSWTCKRSNEKETMKKFRSFYCSVVNAAIDRQIANRKANIKRKRDTQVEKIITELRDPKSVKVESLVHKLVSRLPKNKIDEMELASNPVDVLLKNLF